MFPVIASLPSLRAHPSLRGTKQSRKMERDFLDCFVPTNDGENWIASFLATTGKN